MFCGGFNFCCLILIALRVICCNILITFNIKFNSLKVFKAQKIENSFLLLLKKFDSVF